MTASPEVIVLAHGVGARADLPVPLSLALYGAGLAVLISFLALVLLWRTSKLRGDAAGQPLPALLQRIVDAPVLRWVLRLAVLAVTLLVVAIALVGPSDSNANLSAYALYVTFWVGLVPVSLLLGPVWRAVNPLRTLHAGLSRLTGPAPAADRLPSLGYWPAAVSLLAFLWLELVLPGRAEPRTVGLFLVLYGGLQLVASLWFGVGWFSRGTGSRSTAPCWAACHPSEGATTVGWCCARRSTVSTGCGRSGGSPPPSSSWSAPPGSTGCRAPSSGRRDPVATPTWDPDPALSASSR